MKDEQLFDKLTDAIAKAETAAASANAAAANASSAQSSTGAAGGTASARTQSNKESDSENASVFKSVQQDSDIGIPEAWSANVKRTYDVHQTYDLEGQTQNRNHYNTLVTQLQTHLANVNQLSLQSIANNQNQSNVANGMLVDRAWNVNETDGFSVLLSKVVGDAVAEALKKQ